MTVEELYQSTGLVHDGDCLVCEDIDGTQDAWFTKVGEVLLGVIVGLIAAVFIAGVSFGIYKLGYFMARGLEWKSPPEIQMYEKYLYYKQYEDGSYEATLKDNTKVTGCIAGALCRED